MYSCSCELVCFCGAPPPLGENRHFVTVTPSPFKGEPARQKGGYFKGGGYNFAYMLIFVSVDVVLFLN